ncbi:MAG: peptidase domain-containing ABC transporter [Blastocatellia bacterium]
MTTALDQTELQQLLAESDAFAALSADELRQCASLLELVHYSLGQQVCQAGDEADAFYVVYSGRARVVAELEPGRELTVGALTRGNHFGEQGLLNNARRQYTVRAASDLDLLRLSRADFERLLETQPELRGYFANYVSDLAVRNFLKLSQLFAPLTPAEIRGLLGLLQTKSHQANDVILREGAPAEALYLLRRGSVRLVQESQGNKIVGRLRTGESFGLTPLLTGQTNATTVIADEAVEVFWLKREDFEQLAAATPKFRESLASVATATIPVAPATPLAAAPAPFLRESPALVEPATNGFKKLRHLRYPALLQLSETDCGAACLAMILRYNGKHVSINRLRELANVGREGASLHSVAQAGEALGFHTRGLRASYDHLLKIELPAIVHWEGYHYIVLYEAKPDRVVVADPAVGLRKLSREEFERGWTGYLLQLTPTPALDGVEESKGTIKRFLPLLKPYRALLAEIFLASIVIQLFGLASPVFMQVIVDKVLVHKNVPMLNLMLLGMLIVAVFQTATVALRHYLMVHTSRRIDLQMVVGFYRHVLSLPLRFFEERKVGDILKRFAENQKVRDFLTGRALSVILDCMMIVVYLALMFYYNPKMTLLALAFIPGYVVLTWIVTPRMQRQYREAFQRAADAESQMVEAVTAVGTVKATAAERSIRWKWEGLMVKSLNVQFRSAMTAMGAYSVSNVLQTLSTTMLLWFGAHLVINGELSVGQLMAFNVLVGSVTHPIMSMIDLWHNVQEVNIALERLNDVFDAKPEEDAAQQSLIQLPQVRGHLRFEGVTFRYPTRPDRNALQNITLEIYPGQTVALIGRSGAGKTTFANLLLRMHQPNEGRIFIDGYDLRQVSLNSLRAQVGVVPQDVFLFSGTIRENIAFGQTDAPLEEVVGAAMLAGAHEFISELPLGYETVIGERGQSLSGGQKQRVAIARALFKKPRILIFDEATSALDTESERAIQQNLDKILKDRTTLIIAHRLSTVRNADLIVVMDRGAIVETGNHYSLMEQRGLYYYLNSQQLEG